MALAAAWLIAGAAGAVSYVRNYDLYRGFSPPITPAGVPRGRLVNVRFFSPALGRRRSYLAYLPPGYRAAAARGVRFPVLYLLHAPPGRPAGYVLAGAINVRADVLIARRRIRPFLMVIPNGKSGTFGNDTEWANARAGRYEDFVLDTVRAVDRRWATLPARNGRAIAGLSEGGYGAANIALHNPGVFATFESWSGYFEQTPTYSFKGASRALLAANSPSAYVSSLAPVLKRLPLRAYLYQGRQDRLYPADRMRAFARRFAAAGGHVRYSLYPGRHSWKLWRAQIPHMLRFASDGFGATR